MKFESVKKYIEGTLVIKNQLYELGNGQDITFVENQQDGTTDKVTVKNRVAEGKSFFVKELYVPGVSSQRNRCDIVCGYVDEDNTCRYYLACDVKRNVSLDKTILKLCAQWKAALDYLFELLENEAERNNGEVGVCTATWDEEKLRSELYYMSYNLEKIKSEVANMPTITRLKVQSELLLRAKDITLMKNCLDRRFLYTLKDGQVRQYNIQVYIMDETSDGYATDLVIEA